ncbi:cytochrome P450 [Cristinia sonorae]|uniref:Cytochrome P450 n=1 Tax=Cristinia sonorae TaxID=1940300 RepID=A0A8K0UQ77_9AGAR|nr:cytochrome P450 [Cristinia sonorae]
MISLTHLSPLPVTYILLLLASLRVVYSIWIRNSFHRRPPGPTPIPLLGNVHQLPMDYQERAMQQWGKRFDAVGNLIYARFFRRHTIMINSIEVAQDLLEKRGANYSDRPPFVLHTELMGWKSMLVHMRYGDNFRIARKWAHDAFSNKNALKSYIPLQHKETYTLLAGLVDSPQDMVAHFARFTAATITEITYGHAVTGNNDPYIHLADEAAGATVEAGSPASMLVDFIPILKYYPTWLPGAGWKLKAYAVRDLAKQMVDYPYNMVKSQMAAGVAQPSLVSKVIEQISAQKGSLTPEDEQLLKSTAGTLYGAGVETTQNVFTAFVLAMVRYPHVFQKAREEVDRVVGVDRLPDFGDRESLPYLECVIKETMRWHVPTPLGILGIPHYTMKDDVYNGWVIPARSLVITNIWAIANNPTDFTEPEEFRPERWEAMGKEKSERLDPRNYVFGFGRRLCPARDFADKNSFLVLANMIATLNIKRALDDHGREIVPEHSYKSGFVHSALSHIHPFKCDIKPRSAQAARLIAQLVASS